MLLASLVCAGNQRVFCAIIVYRNALGIEIKIFSRLLDFVYVVCVISYEARSNEIQFDIICIDGKMIVIKCRMNIVSLKRMIIMLLSCS